MHVEGLDLNLRDLDSPNMIQNEQRKHGKVDNERVTPSKEMCLDSLGPRVWNFEAEAIRKIVPPMLWVFVIEVDNSKFHLHLECLEPNV